MLPPSQYLFPDPIEHDPEGEGLICIGADLAPSTLLQAYRQGLFPWFSADEPICWWSPEPRCIIQPNAYKASKSLLRSMKKYHYTLTANRAFEQVMRNCAAPRSYANETWISEDIIQGYCGLFHAGHGYSIEVWENSGAAQQLVGGLYGVTIGRGCFGESMFSRRSDVSKMAFYLLMCIAQREQLPWIDCQLVNDHLLSLGASTLSRQDYLNSLQVVIADPAVDWQFYQERVFSSVALALSTTLF